MRNLKKIYPVILCLSLLANGVMICGQEEKAVSNGRMAFKIGAHIAGILSMFYSGFECKEKSSIDSDEESSVSDIAGVAGFICHGIGFGESLFRLQPSKDSVDQSESEKNSNFWWGLGYDSVSVVSHIAASILVRGAGENFKSVRSNWGDGSLHEDAVKDFKIMAFRLIVGGIAQMIGYFANERGTKLIKRSKGMKVSIKLSEKFRARCPSCDHSDKMKNFITKFEKKDGECNPC